MNTPTKRKHLSSFLDNYEYARLSISIVSDVLGSAEKDGVTHLIVSQDEYSIIKHYLIHAGCWNWDKKTFMGMEFVILD